MTPQEFVAKWLQEFKEAFNMIDQNRDGFIDKEDLHDMLASLGKNHTSIQTHLAHPDPASD